VLVCHVYPESRHLIIGPMGRALGASLATPYYCQMDITSDMLAGWTHWTCNRELPPARPNAR
jgi:hypothetical protein